MEWKGKKMETNDRFGRRRGNRITKRIAGTAQKNLEGRNVRDEAGSLTSSLY